MPHANKNPKTSHSSLPTPHFTIGKDPMVIVGAGAAGLAAAITAARRGIRVTLLEQNDKVPLNPNTTFKRYRNLFYRCVPVSFHDLQLSS